MKTKIVTLILTSLFICLQAIHAEDPFSHLDKETQKKYWDFLSERLFHPDNREYATFKNKEISLMLSNATQQDSLVVNNLVEQLCTLVPDRKIQIVQSDFLIDTLPDIWLFFSIMDSLNRTTGRFDSVLSKYKNSHGAMNGYKDIYGNKIEYDRFNGFFNTKLHTQFLLFSLNDSVSNALRKTYIECAVLRSMCYFKGKHSNIRTFIRGAIFNQYFFDPEGTEFKEVDKFLISKLYSDDFEEQYRNYMLTNYTWVKYYWPYFQEFFKIVSRKVIAILIGIFLLVLSYKKIFIHKYRKPFLGYIIPALVTALIASVVILVYSSIQIEYIKNAEKPLLKFGKELAEPIIVLSFAFAIITSLLYVIEKFLLYSFIKRKKQLKVFTLPLLLLFIFLIVFIASGYQFDLFSVLTGGFMIGMIVAVGRGILLYLNNISELQLREKEVEISRLKEQKAKAEIQSLHARINPHFLYNSLNSIAGLVHSNPNKTEQMALSLSDLFRYTINRSGKQVSTVKEEIEMVKTYLEIEKIRFGERMSYKIDVDKELEQAQVPMYIVQPLVENAIKHGISKISGKGRVSLTVSKSGDDMVVEVGDNGPSFTDGLVSGYGLQSVHDILKLTFGDKAGIVWQNEPDKSIRINFPLLISEK